MRRHRAELRRRLARLTMPPREVAHLRLELAELEAKWCVSSEQIEAMSDEELDEHLAAHAAEDGPYDRIDELRRQLGTPAERRARLARSDAEDAAFMAELGRPL